MSDPFFEASSDRQLDLLSKHLRSLYLTDRQGLLRGINQWDGGTVPYFHLARCAGGTLRRFHEDLSAALITELNDLCEREPALLTRSPVHAGNFLDLLAAHVPVRESRQGPVFSFPQLKTPDQPAAADIIRIGTGNCHLLEPQLADWLPDVPYRQPFLAACHQGQAVAVCASVRITTECHEAGVETAPAFRRRGFAAAVTQAWARQVRALGAEPVYSTTWENAASQGVARTLGLLLTGVDFSIS